MDLWINAVDIARRSLRSIRLLLKYEYLMPAVSRIRVVESQTKLKGHIEAGDAGREFDSGKIVNRKVRFLDELYNPVKPTLIGNGEGCICLQAELRKADDVGQI